jgi:hypothetical protein
MMAKQTGPRGRVKAAASRGSWLVLLVMTLAGCAMSTPRWHHAGRTAAETRLELAACERAAERDTLQAIGRSRQSYGIETASGVSGGRSGQNPMILADRSETAGRFRDAVADCMYAMGYGDTRAVDRELGR